jgi:hypothetical protein
MYIPSPVINAPGDFHASLWETPKSILLEVVRKAKYVGNDARTTNKKVRRDIHCWRKIGSGSVDGMAAVAMQHPRGIVSSAALRNAETLFETQTVVEIREVIPVGLMLMWGHHWWGYHVNPVYRWVCLAREVASAQGLIV